MRLETERLILRPFTWADYDVAYAIAADPDTTRYLYWWGNHGSTPDGDAKRFLERVTAGWEKKPVMAREFALVLKETGEVIGDGSIEELGDGAAEIGWILLPEYRGKGYVTEMARELVRFGFEERGVQKIIATCDARNQKSRNVMERLMMQPASINYGVRPMKDIDGVPGDEMIYALTNEQYDGWQDAAKMEKLPCEFNGFMDLPDLTDGELRLICFRKDPADPVKRWVPAYHFYITKGSEKVGRISLRVGYCPGLYVGGNIGYGVDEQYRGRGYAGRACKLLLPVLKYHKMPVALITNDINNTASRRVCEKLGLRFVRQMDIPMENDMYKNGTHRANIYAMEVK